MKNEETMKESIQKKIADSRRVYRFIFFYILRELWKKYKHNMSDLYMLLFDYNSDDNEDENDGKRTDDDDKNRHNKTLYDKIMRLEGIGNAFQNRTERISDITGIAQQYFLGDEFLPNPVSREDWIRFIGLRLQWQQDKARQKPLNKTVKKPEELKEAEKKIKEALACKTGLAKLPTFQNLRYFAENGCKADITFEDSLANLEMMIRQCGRYTLEHMTDERLSTHRDVVAEYLHRVEALLTLRHWK